MRRHRVLAGLLSRLERRYVASCGSPPWVPVFIIGAARTGTTLVYQCVARALKVSYFSNWMVRFPTFPAIVAKLASYVCGCTPLGIFTSEHGKTAGWRSPSQTYQIWSRWFPRQGDRTEILRGSVQEGYVFSPKDLSHRRVEIYILDFQGDPSLQRPVGKDLETAESGQLLQEPLQRSLSCLQAELALVEAHGKNPLRGTPEWIDLCGICQSSRGTEEEADGDRHAHGQTPSADGPRIGSSPSCAGRDCSLLGPGNDER